VLFVVGSSSDTYFYHHCFRLQVSDLREADLMNDTETRHCQFTRLHEGGQGWSAWEAARTLVSPVVLPSFFYAGQVHVHVKDGACSLSADSFVGTRMTRS
jgi:hypothetical protein